MPLPTQRVVGLLPSATEMVYAVGARESLVGISHECDSPADLDGLPAVISTKLFASAASADIDRDVRRILKDALGVYDVETELLAELRPGVIVTQDPCDVCAEHLAGRALVDSLEILAACQHPEVFSDPAEQHAGGFPRVD